MASRAEVIAEARTWIKTPWRHQGRLKGHSCDCIGVVIGVGVALGLLPAGFNVTGYSRAPDPVDMRRQLETYLDPVERPDLKGGDVLWLAPRRTIPRHTAIYTFEGTMIHAIDVKRGVREHRLDEQSYRIAGVYRYRGIQN